MAYIGKRPSDITRAIATYDTFTGDGSTTTFDLSQAASSANDIIVVVNNVRQEPGASKSYTLGLDGNGASVRVTFNTAPEAADEIYVINPTRVESIARAGDVSANAITGQTELAEQAADGDFLLIYDVTAGALRKIQKSNIASTETFTSLVQDTTPQLGGQFDVNGNAIGDGTLELLKFSETGSAVNELTITNAATGNGPQLSATGDDTNIDLKLTAKGTGSIVGTGHLVPGANDTFDLVASGNVRANIYTGDLHLSNEAKGANDIDGTTGSWTIQEGADDLYLLNNKSGKKYKFKLEEI